jgi:Domain of unknown function (DUF1772)
MLIKPRRAGVLLSCVAFAVIVRGRERLAAGLGAASALACLLITFFGNVPISKEIKTWNPEALPPDSADLLQQWNIYKYLRSIATIAPFLLVRTVVLPAVARPTSTQEE